MSAARPRDTVLAAIATMVVSWPLVTLLSDPTWVRPGALLVACAAVVGMLGRAGRLHGVQVLALQVLAGVLLAGVLFASATLFYGLPTFATMWRANALILDAEATVQSFSAPAPTTAGMVMLVGCVLGLVAICVDYLAVSRRSPALAGLPLLAAFLGCAANSGPSMHPVFFVLAASAWLAMVGSQGVSRLRRWSTTAAVPLTPVRDVGREGASAFGGTARNLAVGGLALAVVLPVMLPHLPTRYLLTGLGRSEDGVQGETSLGFSQSADLSADLANQSSTPVLTYRTNDPQPQPLRVTVTSSYHGGTWTDDAFLDRPPLVTRATLLGPHEGVAAGVPRHEYQLEVRTNSLRAPSLALPNLLRSADLDGAEWKFNLAKDVADVTRRPASYRVTYSSLVPTADQLERATTTAPRPLGIDLAVDAASRPTVVPLAARLTKGLRTPYAKAAAIQRYLREEGNFEYSLTLARPGRDAAGHEVDPLTNFLSSKRGYCVQFATAMVMMSRAAGIPARLVMGFLPGTQASIGSKDWTVRAHDAHAWPELYLQGLGWTRFEPTPAIRTGPAPSYTITGTGGRYGTGGAVDERVRRAPTTAPAPVGDSAVGRAYASRNVDGRTASGALAGGSAGGSGLWRVLGSLVLVLLGAIVVPGAAWSRRRSRLRRARTPGERVEAQWQSLTERLGDLGMPPPPARTPRQLADYYEKAAFLREEDASALHSLVRTLERVRYARPHPETSDELASVTRDGSTLLRAVRRARRRRDRLQATLLPPSGLAGLRELRAGQARGLRRVGSRVRSAAASALPGGRGRPSTLSGG